MPVQRTDSAYTTRSRIPLRAIPGQYEEQHRGSQKLSGFENL
jgi:hypothetical protein